jgi:flagellar hook-associated protein 3 FlgL
MSALGAQADKLTTQLATNKRIQAPSDDAAAYRALTALKRQSADGEAEGANINLASALLAASGTALGSVESQLTRAREIAISAGSATLTPDQKASLAAEIDVITEDLLRVANSTDSRGSPLFSGSSIAPPYMRNTDGTISYTGSGQAGAIPIGDGRTIDATTSGDAIFAGVPVAAGGTSDMFAILQSMSATLKAGGDIGSASADIQAATNAVTNARASIGARSARLELEQTRVQDLALTREEARSKIEDIDVPATITELQKTLTVLQATQASFSKLTQLSLFNYLQ